MAPMDNQGWKLGKLANFLPDKEKITKSKLQALPLKNSGNTYHKPYVFTLFDKM